MRTDYLNPAIYNKLYGAMTYENVLALRVSLETGLRVGDVLALTGSQIIGRTIRGTAEKTGKKYRKVISYDLAKRLKQLPSNTAGYIFPHRTKPTEHRTRQAVWQNMKKAAALMGVQLNAAPHSARKTYAVQKFHDSGLEAAMKELQHDRLSTTMLYAFSDMLQGEKNSQPPDISAMAEEIAERTAAIVISWLDKWINKR